MEGEAGKGLKRERKDRERKRRKKSKSSYEMLKVMLRLNEG